MVKQPIIAIRHLLFFIPSYRANLCHSKGKILDGNADFSMKERFMRKAGGRYLFFSLLKSQLKKGKLALGASKTQNKRLIKGNFKVTTRV